VSLKSKFSSDVRIKYLVAGGWNTLFGMAIFGLLLAALEDKIGYIGVLSVATPITIVQAHAIQRKFVWHTSSLYGNELFKFATVYFVQYLLNVVLLLFLVEVASMRAFNAQVLATGVLVLVSFALNRKWTFSSSDVS
jgi:putative flippase GtrA